MVDKETEEAHMIPDGSAMSFAMMDTNLKGSGAAHATPRGTLVLKDLLA